MTEDSMHGVVEKGRIYVFNSLSSAQNTPASVGMVMKK